jgi:hypothetical protein
MPSVASPFLDYIACRSELGHDALQPNIHFRAVVVIHLYVLHRRRPLHSQDVNSQDIGRVCLDRFFRKSHAAIDFDFAAVCCTCKTFDTRRDSLVSATDEVNVLAACKGGSVAEVFACTLSYPPR